MEFCYFRMRHVWGLVLPVNVCQIKPVYCRHSMYTADVQVQCSGEAILIHHDTCIVHQYSTLLLVKPMVDQVHN